MKGGLIARLGLLWTMIATAGCGGSPDTPDMSSWASEADDVVMALTDAYDAEDSDQTARFYSAGGTLDLTIWRQGVATTPDAIVKAVEGLWFEQPGFAVVRAQHLFVTPDGAIIWWNAKAQEGFQHWVQTFAFGPRSQATSRAYTGIDDPIGWLDSDREQLLEFVDRYLDAWAGQLPFDAVYTDQVVVRDDITGSEWNGIDEVSASRSDTEPVEAGPWPTVFGYWGRYREAVVVVALGGDCPMLEARRLIFADDVVSHEIRYTHVPSARRCLTDLEVGWWTTFELPDELQDNVTEIVDSGGTPVELVNAEPIHGDYMRWLIGRFQEGGLGPPELAAVWFPPNPDCVDEATGLAIGSDDRYEGEKTIVLCSDERELVWAAGDSGWAIAAILVGLHEFAHHWMREFLDDETRAAFTELLGLETWRDHAIAWDERAVERAAYTIAWGLAGNADARYRWVPTPACEELAARYEMLTRRPPLTTCGEEGWSQ